MWREGDLAGAEAAFVGQIEIFGPNPEPFVSLAMLEASRDRPAPAIARLREAVLRGFSDLEWIESSESWTGVPRSTKWHYLHDAVTAIASFERDWPGWDDFRVPVVSKDVASIAARQRELVVLIDEMSPALGPRLTKLWKRMIDRATAAMLDAYLVKQPAAADAREACDRLLALYAGGPLQRWQPLPAVTAQRLGTVSAAVLARSPDAATRPVALLGQAAAQNARRDRQGKLDPATAQEMANLLAEIVEQYPQSPAAGAAIVGLVRTEELLHQRDRARTHYLKFREQNAAQPELLASVQAELGELALQLGGLPVFEARTLDGALIDPEALRGKVVVLEFWATWCRPCVEGFPALRRIDERHGGDVMVVGVNLDSADEVTAEALREWIAREEVPGHHVHDGLGWSSRLVRDFGVREIPFNVVVDGKGAVVAVNSQGKQLDGAVLAALGVTTP